MWLNEGSWGEIILDHPGSSRWAILVKGALQGEAEKDTIMESHRAESEIWRCSTAGFEDGEGPQAKHCGWPREAGKGQEMDSSRELPKESVLPTLDFFLSSETGFLDFWPLS